MIQDKPVPNHLSSIFTSRLMLLLAVLFLMTALLNHQDEMTLLLVLVLLLAGSARLSSSFVFSNLDIAFAVDRTRVFPGETLSLSMTVANRKLLPVRIEIRPLFDSAFFAGEPPGLSSNFLLWHQQTTFTWELTALKRGSWQMGQPSVVAADLFNFFPRQRTRESGIEVLVFPKMTTVHPFLMPEQHFFGMPGERSPVRDPVYIMGTREYQHATPARHIQWKASARIGRLQEKICEPSVQEKILICVDAEGFLSAREPELFERMLEAAAAMAVSFEQKGNAVGFLTNAAISGGAPGVIPLGRNSRNLSGILETLARMEMTPEMPLAEKIRHHGRGLWGTNCILCICRPEPDLLAIRHELRPRRMPVLFITAGAGETGGGALPRHIRTLESIGVPVK